MKELNENVLFHIIAVEALFNRLSSLPSEEEKIKQIRNNLNHYFAEKIVLTSTLTLRSS